MKKLKIPIAMLLFFSIGTLFWTIEESKEDVEQSPSISNSVSSIANSLQLAPRSPLPPKQNMPVAAHSIKLQGGKTLVLVTDQVPSLKEDLKYYGIDNFLAKHLYDFPQCYLLVDPAKSLALANRFLDEKRPRYNFKVWDCYRPMYVQKEMWALRPDPRYVADPKVARHPRGLAVDLTIVDENGLEVEMPTGFDDFSSKAWANAPTTPKAKENRELLRSVMHRAGFVQLKTEWWHFDYIGLRR